MKMTRLSRTARTLLAPLTNDHASQPLGRQLRRCSSRRTQRRGAAAVEFALVAPFFLLLIFGILEVGRLVMVQQVLTTASREGSRVASLDGSAVADVQTAVDSYLASAAISGASVEATPTLLSTTQPGDPVTVTVSVPFADVSWIPSPWFLEIRPSQRAR